MLYQLSYYGAYSSVRFMRYICKLNMKTSAGTASSHNGESATLVICLSGVMYTVSSRSLSRRPCAWLPSFILCLSAVLYIYHGNPPTRPVCLSPAISHHPIFEILLIEILLCLLISHIYPWKEKVHW
uniref:Uncharacterized protein n=1 Tax=Rhipicephalus microplus TaxID=6941 RepID=A0A6G5AGQ7_RHIMP